MAARRFAAVALLLLAGCAQPSGSGSSTAEGKVPTFIPTDHWQAGAGYKNAAVASADREAALLIACNDGPTTLLVAPQKKLPIDGGYEAVTIILDRKITFIQNWQANEEGYGINEKDPGFITVIETLQKYQEVRFVLGRPGPDIDDRSFTLNGAKAAIDMVLAECKKA